MGNHVVCLDVDAAKIRVLEDGGMPIHEPGLEPLRKAMLGLLALWLIVSVGVFDVAPDATESVGTVRFLVVAATTVVVSKPSAKSGALAATRYVEAPSAGFLLVNVTLEPDEKVPYWIAPLEMALSV